MSLLSRCTRHTGAIASLPVLLMLGVAACGGDKVTDPPPPPPPATTGSVAGVVRSTGTPVAGAVVGIGGRTVTTGADGHFQLDNVASGNARLTCSKPGFEDYSVNLTIGTDVTAHDVTLVVRQVYSVGGTSVFVPAGVPAIRGAIIAFGGPDTRCFADARIACVRENPPPNPNLEGALQQMGASYRALAAARGLAVVGRESATTDQVIFDALSTVAAQSGRPELADVPFVAHGLSAGGPYAYGIATRNPERAVGLVLRVAAAFDLADPTESHSTPALVIIAGAESIAGINAFNRTMFNVHRTAGAPWAFAEEPGAPHHWLSNAVLELVVNWVETVFEQRLPASPNGPLRPVAESAGWLGDPVTFGIASWAEFAGDRGSASWLPSQATAQRWRAVVQPQ
jgi:dienelactone hydrolase